MTILAFGWTPMALYEEILDLPLAVILLLIEQSCRFLDLGIFESV